jgi:hypothetical protein
MPEHFHYIEPAPIPHADIFATQQLTFDFRRETQYRQTLKSYYSWYHSIAQQHRQELSQMRQEANLLRWFHRGK